MLWILVALASLNLILFVAIEKVARRWPTWRSMLTTAVALPGLLWLAALVFDIRGAIWHSRHPEEPFMGGLSIYLFPLAIMGIAFGIIVILAFIFVRDAIRPKS